MKTGQGLSESGLREGWPATRQQPNIGWRHRRDWGSCEEIDCLLNSDHDRRGRGQIDRSFGQQGDSALMLRRIGRLAVQRLVCRVGDCEDLKEQEQEQRNRGDHPVCHRLSKIDWRADVPHLRLQLNRFVRLGNLFLRMILEINLSKTAAKQPAVVQAFSPANFRAELNRRQ